jgi:hypothetical protein
MISNPAKVSLGEIRSTQQGFSRLSIIAAALGRYVIDVVEVDFSACTWFDANMSAPLGVVFAHAIDNFNDLKLRGLRPNVESILEKIDSSSDSAFRRRKTFTARPSRTAVFPPLTTAISRLT